MAKLGWTDNARFWLFKVVKPVLTVLGEARPALDKPEAAYLLIGTAAAETRLTLRDQEKGPALGPCQVEPATYLDIYERYLRLPANADIKDAVDRLLLPSVDRLTQVSSNPFFNFALARLRYYWSPKPLPHMDDIEGQAEYWKRTYNSAGGKGKTEHYIESWYHYVLKRDGRRNYNEELADK